MASDWNELEDGGDYFKRLSQERLARIAELERRLIILRQAMPSHAWEDLLHDYPEAVQWFDDNCT